MRVTFVVPRYGLEVRGGAELAARLLAEHLVADLGWDIDVLTTCALDNRTWASEYAPGSTAINGVTVHRFANGGRDPRFEDACLDLLGRPRQASPAAADDWIDLQGPVSDGLLDAVRESSADALSFHPYLYHPTVRGLPVAGRRGILHPAAHEEAPLHLPVFRGVFQAAAGLAYYTLSERRLVERTFAIGATRQLVVGLGVDDEVTGGSSPVARPYVLYVGRVDDGKGTRVLADFFAGYKRRRPGPLRLAIAGPVLDRPTDHPDIDLLGEVDEATKWALYRGATAFVNPSAYESFSIVLMEAWTCGLPVLVNGRSEVLREHCIRSGGGLWFDRYSRFEAALDAVLGNDELARQLGDAGREYVATHYRWPALVERYRDFVEAVAANA